MASPMTIKPRSFSWLMPTANPKVPVPQDRSGTDREEFDDNFARADKHRAYGHKSRLSSLSL